METSMLRELDFRITTPTVYVFINRLLRAAAGEARQLAPDQKLLLLSTYLVERTLQEYRLLAHVPSKVAAACMAITLRTLKGREEGCWSVTMRHYSGYSLEELSGAIGDVMEVMAAAPASTLQAVRKKYLNPKYGEVAAIPLERPSL
jgi:hypothetical protein